MWNGECRFFSGVLWMMAAAVANEPPVRWAIDVDDGTLISDHVSGFDTSTERCLKAETARFSAVGFFVFSGRALFC